MGASGLACGHFGRRAAVAGYSDYFCDLAPELQEEIIARTEHTGFTTV
jgi:hypothetical protein